MEGKEYREGKRYQREATGCARAHRCASTTYSWTPSSKCLTSLCIPHMGSGSNCSTYPEWLLLRNVIQRPYNTAYISNCSTSPSCELPQFYLKGYQRQHSFLHRPAILSPGQ